MRTDPPEFSGPNSRTVREPTFLIVVKADSGDFYFTSKPISDLSGPGVFDGVLKDVSATSQNLNPDRRVSEIGSMRVRLINDGLTDWMRDLLTDDEEGLKGKRVELYVGLDNPTLAECILVQTQLIREVSYGGGYYSLRSSDVQREMKKNLFDLKKTSLAQSLTLDSPTIEVYSTEGFELVHQPASSSGLTESPGTDVGYVKVSQGDSYEIIRWSSKSATSFTIDKRACFGTKQIEITRRESETSDNAPKVEEFVYLEMPVVMAMYALFTGSLYGYPGKSLPGHWNLGISPGFIRTTDFINIGSDLWDTSNFDNGRFIRLVGIEKEDGKKFIEEQLHTIAGTYPIIYSDGQVGLRRMQTISETGGAVRNIGYESIVDFSEVTYDFSSVINVITVDWNWVGQKEAYTRTNALIDSESISRWGQGDEYRIQLRGLSGTRHTYTTIRDIFQSLRDRYSGPPLRMTLTLTPDHNNLEVGDVIRVTMKGVQDFTGKKADGSLDRNFEIQQINTDWKTGKVKVSLFGSSAPAKPVDTGAGNNSAALSDPWYVESGTEISGVNFPGAVSSVGGITTITSDITLSGDDVLTDSGAIYYCGEDLTINAGVTVTITKNVQLRVRGFFQNNGTIDGEGNGPAGGTPVTTLGPVANFSSTHKLSSYQPENKGVPGFLYSGSIPQGGGQGIYYDISGFAGGSNVVWSTPTNGLAEMAQVGGQYISAPALELSVQGGALVGLPDNLQGGSGSGGEFVAYSGPGYPSPGINKVRDGTPGGAGGAGLAIISRGYALGANGLIDVSGVGAEAPTNPWDNPGSGGTIYPGAGGPGGPGAVYFIVDGTNNVPGDLSSENLQARFGDSNFSGSRSWTGTTGGIRSYTFYTYSDPGGFTANNPKIPVSSPEGLSPPSDNIWESAHRVQILVGGDTPIEDVPDETDEPSSIVATELLNTPRTPNANISTIEVYIEEPGVNNYSHSIVEYRPQGTEGWYEAGPASPETSFTVASDGTTYEIRARGVSYSGIITPTGIITTLTTTKIVGVQPGDELVDQNIVVPDVTGLELFDQANDTEFTGKDAKFSWRKTSVSEWYEVGSEGQLGAGSGSLDLYFKDYQVEVWANGELVRTEWVVDPLYTYTHEKNSEDYFRKTGLVGAWRTFGVRIYCRGRQNQLSASAARLEVSNPAPVIPGAITISPSIRSISVEFDTPEDLDYTQTRVWLSQTPGFTPDDSNRVAATYGSPINIDALSSSTTYYLRMATYDQFGMGLMSPEFSVTTAGVSSSDVSGLGPWAIITTADQAFINAYLDDDSIQSTKIEKLVASKIATGTLAATEKITTAGVVEAVSGSAIASLGPVDILGNTALISYTYSGQPLFAVYDDGQVVMGDDSTGQYVKWDGTSLVLGPGTAIAGAVVIGSGDETIHHIKLQSSDFVDSSGVSGTAVVEDGLGYVTLSMPSGTLSGDFLRLTLLRGGYNLSPPRADVVLNVMEFSLGVFFGTSADMRGWVGYGQDSSGKHIGFEFQDDKVYACNGDLSGGNSVELVGVSASTVRTYSFEWSSGKVVFKVDGVVEHTATTKVPLLPDPGIGVAPTFKATAEANIGSGTNKISLGEIRITQKVEN